VKEIIVNTKKVCRLHFSSRRCVAAQLRPVLRRFVASQHSAAGCCRGAGLTDENSAQLLADAALIISDY